MTEIKKTAKKLAAGNEEIRNGIKELMKKWTKISECGEEIYSSSIVIHGKFGEYRLVTGKQDVETIEGKEYSSNCYFYTGETIQSLRDFLHIFPTAIEEIRQEMEKRNMENQKLLKLLEKIQ